MHLPETLAQIDLMQPLGLTQLRVQRLDGDFRQHAHPVLAALAVSHQDLPVGDIYIFYPQTQALH